MFSKNNIIYILFFLFVRKRMVSPKKRTLLSEKPNVYRKSPVLKGLFGLRDFVLKNTNVLPRVWSFSGMWPMVGVKPAAIVLRYCCFTLHMSYASRHRLLQIMRVISTFRKKTPAFDLILFLRKEFRRNKLLKWLLTCFSVCF